MSDRLSVSSSFWSFAVLPILALAPPAWAMEDPALGRWLTTEPRIVSPLPLRLPPSERLAPRLRQETAERLSDVGNPYMFQGVPHFALDTSASATSGKLMLNHHRARFEDVATGRWVTRDPLEYDANLFAPRKPDSLVQLRGYVLSSVHVVKRGTRFAPSRAEHVLYELSRNPYAYLKSNPIHVYDPFGTEDGCKEDSYDGNYGWGCLHQLTPQDMSDIIQATMHITGGCCDDGDIKCPCPCKRFGCDFSITVTQTPSEACPAGQYYVSVEWTCSYGCWD